MNKGTKIFLGVGAAAVLTTVIVLAVKSGKKPSSDSALDKPADASDFDLLYLTFNQTGKDIFVGASDFFKEQMKTLLIKNLTKRDVKRLIEIIKKKERDWTPSEKNEFSEIYNKWKKGFIANVPKR